MALQLKVIPERSVVVATSEPAALDTATTPPSPEVFATPATSKAAAAVRSEFAAAVTALAAAEVWKWSV